MNSRHRVQHFLRNEPTDRRPLMPITMMFAADRLGVKYGAYAGDYRVLVEAQIHVAEQFGFDQVSCISDPAREAADLGAKVEFYEDQPPAIDERAALLADKLTLGKLRVPDPLQGGRMLDRVRAAELFRQRVGTDKLIEGWIEGPCAMAADLRGINTLMLDLYDDPAFVRDLFEFVVAMELEFARAQVAAGIDLMGVGDAAASLVGPKFYRELVWPYEQTLIDGLHALGVPVRLHICGNTRKVITDMGRLGCEIVDLDFLTPLDEARAAMRSDQILLGNMDPVKVLRNGTPELVHTVLTECHRQAGPRYIVGAGCEIPRDTPEENVRVLREYVQAEGRGKR